MSPMFDRGELIESLANTISDYRPNEVTLITSAHVEKWLNQFDQNSQDIVLCEMDTLMRRLFISRKEMKSCLKRFILYHVLNDRLPEDVFPHVEFLNIQQSGGSQAALLSIIDEILGEEYGIRLHQCGQKSVTTYIYVDDAIYTGNRLRCDLENGQQTPAWIRKHAPNNTLLIVYAVGAYIRGATYALNNVKREADKKDINI